MFTRLVPGVFALVVPLALGCGEARPSPSRDMAVVVADMATTPDLSTLPDLVSPIDLTEPDDLTEPPDLRRPQDLAMRRGPICDKVMTRSEGWYAPDGSLICFALCSGATAQCQFPGTRSEGWYSSRAGQGCDGRDLIQFMQCS